LRRGAFGEGRKRLLALMAGEGTGTPHVNASRLGAAAPFDCASADQRALEFSKPTENRQLQFGVRSSCPPMQRRASGIRRRPSR
jgi:hypothetical protein